ncbi:MAG: holo-ACP synthase [Opitutaceae bacterium]
MKLALPPGGIVLGLGCDIVEVARVKGVIERQGERFLERVFAPEERSYCQGRGHPFPHYAARFAAKEAISKAFATGIGAELGWRTAWIAHGDRREPLVRLDEKGRELLRSVGGTSILVSLSHTAGLAMAVAALVREPGA